MRKVVLLAASAALSVFAAGSGAAIGAEEKVLNVYNWSDYIAEDTLARFTEETGIKVNYDVYDSNEIVEAKLSAGKSGYDVVFPSAMPFLARQVKAGIYQKLDKAKLKNLGGLEQGVLNSLEKADPGLEHAVPYMVAGTGIGFNVEKIRQLAPDAPVDSWALIFDPEWSSKLKDCGVTLLDDASEVFPAALAYLGKDPNSDSPEDLKAAAAVIDAIRGNLKYVHSSTYINDLANGEICVAHGYGGDLIQARDRATEANNGVWVQVFLPKEGAQVVIDVMAIPADAPHPENAHAFIDFMMRPDVVGPITEAVGYANAVKGADAFVSEERKADPVIYPPQETRDRFFSVSPKSPSYDRLRTREWTRIKTGQ
ncbi:MAG: polyamine ABC transporter substrate-binding protein [Minwuia sp.]|uniref:polyamine ABC transporter substrate-binding protein n=1 Tax=Minwuia sp. TaxID=2493630 RepID=UPI003A8BCE0E